MRQGHGGHRSLSPVTCQGETGPDALQPSLRVSGVLSGIKGTGIKGTDGH